MPERRPAPTAPSLAPRQAPRRTDLSDDNLRDITRTCAEAGVPAPPWLAWARSAAVAWGPEEATRRACRGATTEPAWADVAEPTRRRRWHWR